VVERRGEVGERRVLGADGRPDPEAHEAGVAPQVHAVGAAVRPDQVAEPGVVPRADVAPDGGRELLAEVGEHWCGRLVPPEAQAIERDAVIGR
jgi:hypothetical protein